MECNLKFLKFKIFNFIILELEIVKDRNVEDLSGGELQRFACAITCVRKSDM